MAKLPKMPYRDQITKAAQIQFGGLHHSVQCGEGQVYDMDNMCCDDYPYIKTAGGREVVAQIGKAADQVYVHGGDMIYTVGHELWYKSMAVGRADADWKLVPQLTHNIHQFISFGDRVVMMPDKVMLNLTYPIRGVAATVDDLPASETEGVAWAVEYRPGTALLYYNLWVWLDGRWQSAGRFDQQLEAEVSNLPATTEGIGFGSGELFGEFAYGSQLFLPLGYEYVTQQIGFKVGDAVTIKGCSVPENNKTAVIREIADVSPFVALRFTPYTFSKGYREPEDEEDGVWWQDLTASVGRYVPDLDVMFEQGNRMWGAKGKDIYASALGDPSNWFTFDGTAADSWYLRAQAKGDVRGGFDMGSYPAFLTGESMLIVYGTMPSAYQLYERSVPGLRTNGQASIVSAGDYHFWHSPEGMVMYSGDGFRVLSDVFGDWPYMQVLSGVSAGQRAFLAAQLDEDVPELLIFSAQTGQWSKETMTEAMRKVIYDSGEVYGVETVNRASEKSTTLYRLSPYGDGEIWASRLEFGDMIDGSPNVKAVNRLQLRIGMEANAEVTIKIRYDDEVTEIIKTISTGAKRKANVIIPVRPRRCDHYRLIFEGTGQWMLWSMAKEYYVGSDMNR